MRLLLASDLDGTLLPAGTAPESPLARRRLRVLARRPEITLAYLSGRHRALIERAIGEWGLPEPRFAGADVGTSLYRVEGGAWRHLDRWQHEIAGDWRGRTREELEEALRGTGPLRLQEPERQGRFKLSYYAPWDTVRPVLAGRVRERLEALGVEAAVVWSADEARRVGLVDIVPRGATKLHALRFLLREEGFAEDQVLFAGDSGNDLEVLASGIPAVLVGNASEDVRREALRRVAGTPREDRLYLARGGFLGMNGNYAAGALEGLAHFFPQVEGWLGRPDP